MALDSAEDFRQKSLSDLRDQTDEEMNNLRSVTHTYILYIHTYIQCVHLLCKHHIYVIHTYIHTYIHGAPLIKIYIHLGLGIHTYI